VVGVVTDEGGCEGYTRMGGQLLCPGIGGKEGRRRRARGGWGWARTKKTGLRPLCNKASVGGCARVESCGGGAAERDVLRGRNPLKTRENERSSSGLRLRGMEGKGKSGRGEGKVRFCGDGP